MQLVHLDGVDLECDVAGTGDPVLLIHGGFVDTFFPTPAKLDIAGRYRLISFHRRGYGRSSRATAPGSIEQHAADARALLDHLDIQRAHVAGHSFGGAVATQLSFDAPDRVGSLALVEPGFIALAPSGPALVAEIFAVAGKLYESGDRAGAVDAFFTSVGGPDFRPMFEKCLPGAFERAVADSDTAFGIEQDAIQGWSFAAEDAARVGHPVLSVLGGDSLPVFHEIHAAVLQCIPHAEALTVPGANHALAYMSPEAVSEGMGRFFDRHPL